MHKCVPPEDEFVTSEQAIGYCNDLQLVDESEE